MDFQVRLYLDNSVGERLMGIILYKSVEPIFCYVILICLFLNAVPFSVFQFSVFALPQGAAHSSEFFRGCIKNLRINGTLVDWHSIAKLVDVHVSACPISLSEVFN